MQIFAVDRAIHGQDLKGGPFFSSYQNSPVFLGLRYRYLSHQYTKLQMLPIALHLLLNFVCLFIHLTLSACIALSIYVSICIKYIILIQYICSHSLNRLCSKPQRGRRICGPCAKSRRCYSNSGPTAIPLKSRPVFWPDIRPWWLRPHACF